MSAFRPRSVPTVPFILLLGALLFPGACSRLPASLGGGPRSDARGSYAVVVSEATYARPEWRRVVDTLRKKHDGAVIVYGGSVLESKELLAGLMPRYACFVAPWQEARRDFVIDVHRLTRDLDADPYPDLVWGILTGYDAADAQRIAERSEPLVVRRGLGGCGSLDLAAFETGYKYDEGKAGGRTVKLPGREPADEDFPVDSTQGLVDGFNRFKPDVFMTSGHATSKNWMIGYNYRDGFFKCDAGRLYGEDTQGKRLDIDSPNPKIYMPSGNCLIGHIPQQDCMALALMHTAGVHQMFGYTVVTFCGYAGWGVSDLFVGERGRHTFAQAFHLNQVALMNRLVTEFPRAARLQIPILDGFSPDSFLRAGAFKSQDEAGLAWDRDTLAFYGDPAWEVRFPVQASPAWTAEWSARSGEQVFTVRTHRPGKWGSRPLMALLPGRFEDIRVMAGQEFKPVIADSFILLPVSGDYPAGLKMEVRFTGHRAPLFRTAASQPPRFTWTLPAGTSAADRAVLAQIPPRYQKPVSDALGRAGANRPEIARALETAPAAQRAAMAFLVAGMPPADLSALKADYLLKNVDLAFDARARAPWGPALTEDLFLNEVLPYASLDERRDDWRADFRARFEPVIAGCRTPLEAADKLNRTVFPMLKVQYHATKRPKPNQSPYESVEAGYASCTGLSVLLVDACRAVGIPARVAGTALWTQTEGGNHTWVEVYQDGWHYFGAAEPGAPDSAWFGALAGKADLEEPIRHIYATSWRPTGIAFPLVWNFGLRTVPAVDVSENYRARKQSPAAAAK